ncbi:hypothetical protein CkaCkLH20_04730 [Colletotrichum karsti]|uniref:C2H2-type domain-containing protein n=1 Tax=Colletotrichum karsti TaxID=1095194 RepID=A0A9P6I830_9PEZI|nr:uncharacterized protein CkaCkLH20_04730 [Colletotrichum karsti]KAF9877595.1 hypothetical protein CkaCkLH20_04730 [Colletotrichum karsti]
MESSSARSDSGDMVPDPNLFENKYERQFYIRRAAQNAGKIIHLHSDIFEELGEINELARNVGLKLRDFISKRDDHGVLHEACLGDVERTDLPTLVAFRSQFPPTGFVTLPADVKHHFENSKPRGYSDFDSYLANRIRNLAIDYYEDTTNFIDYKETPIRYWGQEVRFEKQTNVDSLERFMLKPDDLIGGLSNNQQIPPEHIIDVSNKKTCELFRALASGTINTSWYKEISSTHSGIPIVSESDLIDIRCPLCPHDNPVSTLEQLQRHCFVKAHDFQDIIWRLGRQGQVLVARNSSSSHSLLPTCPECEQLAETWDAVYWHHSKFHSGDIYEYLDEMDHFAYLVWELSREEVTLCPDCGEEFLTQLVASDHAEKHHSGNSK